jgi:membrane protease YdiL (CAAX protease family)
MWCALALSVIVVAYNNVVNRWKSFRGVVYVPLNLTFAAAIAFIAPADLSAPEFGVQGVLLDLAMSGAAVACFALGAFALAGSRHAHLIADKRVEDKRGSALIYYMLVRIPLGTAVTEELVFRGVLFASWRAAGMSTAGAAVCASVAFGLWHISPTAIGVRMNDPAASFRKIRVAVAGAVLLTTIAGLALSWWRIESGSLLGPIVVHGGVNSLGALAAVKAIRRSRREG